MDCTKREDREKSEKMFKEVRTLQEFLKLWRKFYVNEICIPGYYSNFIGAEDNEHADLSMAKKFQKMTKYGVIPVDFQTNSLKNGQRGYVKILIPNDMANNLTEYINRYEGYVAFWNELKDDYVINGLVVTYDPSKEDVKLNQKTGVLFGDPFSRLGYAGEAEFNFIKEWLSLNSESSNRSSSDDLNSDMNKIINVDNFKLLTVIDTMPSQAPDRFLNVVLYALKDL